MGNCDTCDDKIKAREAKRKKAIEYGTKEGLKEVVLLQGKNDQLIICKPDDSRIGRLKVVDRIWLG